MKSFDEYWEALATKNPALRDSAKMTITVESFQRQMRQAFEQGKNSGIEASAQVGSLMDKIFGRPF